MEAVSLYQPCVDIESYLHRPDATEEASDAAEIKTTVLTVNVGTIMDSEELCGEIWNNWQKADMYDWEPVLEHLPRVKKNLAPAKKGKDPIPFVELFSFRKDCLGVGKSDIKALEILIGKAVDESSLKSKKVVAWVLGREPPEPSVKRLFEPDGIFDRQLDGRRNVAVIIVLAAETRADIDEGRQSTLRTTAFPFEHFFAELEKWKKRQKKSLRKRPKSKKRDGTTVYRPADNILVIQWLAFSEILAQVFEKETSEKHSLKYSSPKVETVQHILQKYFDEGAAVGILDRPLPHEEEEGTREEDEETEEQVIKRGGILGFYDRLRPPPKVVKEDVKHVEYHHKTIEGYSELRSIRERFEKKRNPIFMMELRYFLSDFLASVTKETAEKSEVGSKGCVENCKVA